MPTIDKKIVEMDFDNKDFDGNVQDSLKSIDTLKKGLNFDEAQKSLTGLSDAGKNFNLQSISDGVDNISSSFSVMGVAGFTAVQNITNGLIDLGKQLWNSALGIGAMKAGFASYEALINNIQTILASTSGAGTTVDQVTDALKFLDEYSNRVNVNFNDMATSLGKFTAAGLKLELSKEVIKGIANYAGLTGASATQAAGAMDAFSMAVNLGSLGGRQWMTLLQNGMATDQFQKNLIESAKVHGVNVDAIIAKEGSFKASLAKGWATIPILTEALLKYTGDLSAEQLKAMGYTEEQTQAIIAQAAAAAAAATQVKTFSQLKDVVTKNLQAGWMDTWELLVGNFDEAKDLFTYVSDIFNGMVISSSKARNDLLQGWRNWGGYTITIQTLKLAFEGLMGILKPLGEAFSVIFPATTGRQLAEISGFLWNIASAFKFFITSNKTLASLRQIFTGLAAAIDIVRMFIMALANWLIKLGSGVKISGGGILDFIAKIANWVYALRNAIYIGDTFGKMFGNITIFLSHLRDEISQFILKETPFFIAALARIQNALAFIGLEFSKFIGWIGPILTKALSKLPGIISAITTAFNTLVGIVGPWLKARFAEIPGTIASIRAEIETFVATIGPAVDKIKVFFTNLSISIGKVKTFISDTFSKVDMSGINNFTSKLKDRLSPIGTIMATIGHIFVWLWGIFEKFAPVYSKIMSVLGSLLVTIGSDLMKGLARFLQSIGDSLKNFDYNKIFDALNAGLISALFVAIYKFITGGTGALKGIGGLSKTLGGIAGTFKGIGTSISNLLGSVKDTLKAWQEQLKAKILLDIAIAIGILAASLLVLSLIPSEKLTFALGSIGLLFAALAVGIDKITKSTSSTKGAATASVELIAIAGALLVMSVALAIISSIDPVKMAIGLGGIAIVLAVLSGFMYLTKGHKGGLGDITGPAGLVILAGALILMGVAVKLFSMIGLKDLAIGIGGIGATLAVLYGFIKLSPGAKSIAVATALVIMAVALNLLVIPLALIAKMPLEGLRTAVETIIVVLAGITGALILIPPNAILGAAAVVVMSVALTIFAPVLERLGKMDWPSIWKAIVLLGLSLAELTVAMIFMSEGIFGAAAMLVMAPALLIFTPVLERLGKMDWPSIWRAIVLLGLSLLLITAAMIGMSEGIFGAAAMLVMAAALTVLVPVLQALGSMSLGEIATAIGALAAVFGVLALAALLMLPVLPAFFGLDAALILLGVAILSIGGGLLVFSAALTGLSVSGAAGSVAIGLFVTTFLKLLPSIVNALFGAAVQFITLISKTVPMFVSVFGILMTAVLNTILGMLPSIAGGLLDTLQLLLDTIDKHLPDLITSGWSIIKSILKGIHDHIGEATETVSDIITNFLVALAMKMPDMTNAAVLLMVGFIGGLSDAMDRNKDELDKAIDKLVGSIIDGLVAGLTGGLDALGRALSSLASLAISVIKNLLGIHSDSTVFTSIGGSVTKGFVKGILKYANAVGDATEDLGKTAMDGLTSVISDISDAFINSMDMTPTIRPVIDLTDVVEGSKKIGELLDVQNLYSSDTANKLSSIINGMPAYKFVDAQINQNGSKGTSVSFTQNNYSPKALSAIEIYRQTKNQVAMVKGLAVLK